MRNVLLGASDGAFVYAPARYLNRHGLITGSTGTGKSVSLMQLAEALSRLGIPVFVTDVKGDLTGMGAIGDPNFATVALARCPTWYPEANDLKLWDVYGESGRLLSTTVSSMGASIIGRSMALSDTQAGVLEIAFAVAQDHSLPLNTLTDLRAVLNYCVDNRDKIAIGYGRVTNSSVATIGRSILRMQRAGGDKFFGNSTFEVLSLLEISGGRGVINMLDGVRLIREPRLYGAFLLWFLSELFTRLPEVGDTPIPKLAFFFDEAHLLFAGASPELIQEIDQTVRLIRSKGVGIFFASQAPGDLPDCVLRQLHLRIQHTLRAVTASDRAMVKNAALSLTPSDHVNPVEHIESMRTGTALTTFMGADGKMAPVQVVQMAPPRCRLGALTQSERAALVPKVVTIEHVSEPMRVNTSPEASKRYCGKATHKDGGIVDHPEFTLNVKLDMWKLMTWIVICLVTTASGIIAAGAGSMVGLGICAALALMALRNANAAIARMSPG